jgi:ABC-type molybdenum transport system ATPase subunit/photorepair protein PhrA
MTPVVFVAIARALVRKPRVLLLDEGKIAVCHSMQNNSQQKAGCTNLLDKELSHYNITCFV